MMSDRIFPGQDISPFRFAALKKKKEDLNNLKDDKKVKSMGTRGKAGRRETEERKEN